MEGRTLQELEQKLMGLTPEEVIHIMGKKPDVSTEISYLTFGYDNHLPKEYSDRKGTLYLHFKQNKVVNVSDELNHLIQSSSVEQSVEHN